MFWNPIMSMQKPQSIQMLLRILRIGSWVMDMKEN